MGLIEKYKIYRPYFGPDLLFFRVLGLDTIYPYTVPHTLNKVYTFCILTIL